MITRGNLSYMPSMPQELYYDESPGPYNGYTYQGYTRPSSRTQQTTFATHFPARLNNNWELAYPSRSAASQGSYGQPRSIIQQQYQPTGTCIATCTALYICPITTGYASHYMDEQELKHKATQLYSPHSVSCDCFECYLDKFENSHIFDKNPSNCYHEDNSNPLSISFRYIVEKLLYNIHIYMHIL